MQCMLGSVNFLRNNTILSKCSKAFGKCEPCLRYMRKISINRSDEILNVWLEGRRGLTDQVEIMF